MAVRHCLACKNFTKVTAQTVMMTYKCYLLMQTKIMPKKCAKMYTSEESASLLQFELIIRKS